MKKADHWRKCNPCLQAVSDVLNWTWGFSKADMSFSLRGDLFFWAICLGIRQDYLRPFLLALSLLQNTDRSIESLAGLSWFGEAPKSRVGGCYAFHHQDTRVRLHLLFFFLFSPDNSFLRTSSSSLLDSWGCLLVMECLILHGQSQTAPPADSWCLWPLQATDVFKPKHTNVTASSTHWVGRILQELIVLNS